MAVAVWLLIFAVSFVLGYPIAFGMFISGIVYFILSGIDLTNIMDIMVIQFENQFVMLAVPLFIFSAKLMNASRLTDRLFNFAKAIVGPLKGGLAHVNIVSSIIFAGMSGSQIADVAGLGTMEVKAMKDSGFDAPFSCAVTAASATIGPIIPPSIPMVIYSMISGASIGYLFLGGIIPGFILAGCLMVLVYFISVKRGYSSEKWLSWRAFIRVFYDSFFVLLAPVILLAGIYGGIFTPTEAAGVVGIYMLVLCLLVYRSIGFEELKKVLIESVVAIGYTAITIGCAFLFSYVLAREEIPGKIAEWYVGTGLAGSRILTLVTLNILFLILGCFLDTIASLVIVVPIILPLVESAGIDLVHFGVVVVLNLMIGLSTPPYGEATFIISKITDTPLGAVLKEMIIFILFMLIALLIITFLPETVLFIPKLAGYLGV